MLLNNEWIKNEIKEEIKRLLETKENEHTTVQNMGHSEGSPERKVHSNTGLPKRDRNISNKQPKSTSTRTGGTTTNKVQSKQKEGNNKDQNRIK